MSETLTQTEPEAEAPYTWRMTGPEVALTLDKLEKINARAVKRGFTGRWDLVTVPTTWYETMEAGFDIAHHGFEVSLSGTAPCYEGWRFLGVVEAVEGTDGFVVRLAPGAGEVSHEGVRPGECDHCCTVRARKQVMLVEEVATGNRMQVGSTCIKDFLGWRGSLVFIWTDTVEHELREGRSTGTSGGWDADDVLLYSQVAIETWGWVPTGGSEWSDKVPTKTRVSVILSDNGQRGREYRAEIQPHLEAAAALVPVIREALLTAFAGSTSGYEANLLAVLQPGAIVTWKTLGLVSSAPSAYARLVQKKVEKEARAERVDAWIGVEGEKGVLVSGTITYTDVIESYFGNVPTTSKLVILETSTGTVKTFTSAKWAWDESVKAGESLSLKGTVKRHDTFKDHKETILTRCTRTDV